MSDSALRERLEVLIERETGLGGMDSRALADAILKAVAESLPEEVGRLEHEDFKCLKCGNYCFSDEACSCCYLKPGRNSYRTEVLKLLEAR